MLEVIVKFLCSLLGSVAGALMIENISREKLKFNYKNIILLIILSVITTIQFRTTYTIAITLLSYITTIFIYKLIFKISFKRSILVCGMMLLITLIIDMLCAIILLQFVSGEAIRDYKSMLVITNIMVYSFAWGFTYIKPIRKFLYKFISKIDKSKIYSQYIFIMITVVVQSLIIYDFTSGNLNSEKQYIVTLVTFILMLILVLIYIKSKNDNDKLQEQFDYLYDYSENYEDWITKEQLNIHENKNQLIVLRDMLNKNDKAVKYINDILEEDFVLEDKWLGQLSNVPKGGLKGLLYYKLITIEKNDLNFCVDISKNAQNKLKRLQKEQLKDISHIIGIYMDNAIEASVNSKKKMFALEIYCIKKELHIVITNSFNENIDMLKINNKGYTTKGKGRGKGLYFVSKIKDKNPNINTATNIINEYFIQRIIVN